MSGSANGPEYLGSSLASFLELVSAAEPAPGGGAVAAMAVGMAAGLCVMATRLSAAQLPDAADLAARAEGLRDRAAGLTQADAVAYGLVISALRLPPEPDLEQRRRRVATALYRAAEVPAELAEIGADVAGIALRIAEEGNQNLLGDAVTAGLLAEAGARAAGALVAINLKQMPGDDLHRRAVEAVARSAECAGRVRRRVES